jgi:CheY-like chemotaxis protein
MSKPGFSKLDVLVIDPSPHMTALIASMLRHLDIHYVAEVQTADAALALLQNRRFGAIMVNDTLTPMNGIELTRALRNATECINRHTAVIMMSNAPDATEIAAARDAGISEFLRKPFAAAHVESRLVSILAAPRDFIATEAYVGPDRRRKRLAPKSERRGVKGPA